MYRMLVIDDDADFAAWMADHLHQHFQADILIAYTYIQARAALTAHPFDIVLADLLLGDGSAFDLAPDISRYQPAARVVAVTKIDTRALIRRQARATQALAAKIKAFDADAHVVKPVTVDALVHVVAALLANRPPSLPGAQG